MFKKSTFKEISLAIWRCLRNKNIDLLPQTFTEGFTASVSRCIIAMMLYKYNCLLKKHL